MVIVVIVYAWDRYYPGVGSDQIKGVFHNLEDAISFVSHLKEERKFDFVDWEEFKVQ